MNTNLDIYESIAMLSAQMLESAQASDWDRLCELEKDVAELREQLRREDPPAMQMMLDEESRSRKAHLIQKLLADDLEIRSHTAPWMDSVKQLLAGNARQRSVQQAYNSKP